MFGSIRFAVFFVLALFSIVIPIIFGNVLVNSYESKLWEQKEATVQTKCDMMANRISTEGFRFSDTNITLENEVEQYASIMEGRVMIVDQTFRIVKDTYGIEENRYLLTEDVLRAMTGEINTPHRLQNQYLETFYPIMDANNEKSVGVICAIASCQDIIDMEKYMQERRSTVTMLLCTILLVVSYLFSALLTKDYKKFNKNVHYIADGHTDERLEEIGYSEMRQTARTVNEILEKTQMLEDSRQEFVSNEIGRAHV